MRWEQAGAEWGGAAPWFALPTIGALLRWAVVGSWLGGNGCGELPLARVPGHPKLFLALAGALLCKMRSKVLSTSEKDFAQYEKDYDKYIAAKRIGKIQIGQSA